MQPNKLLLNYPKKRWKQLAVGTTRVTERFRIHSFLCSSTKYVGLTTVSPFNRRTSKKQSIHKPCGGGRRWCLCWWVCKHVPPPESSSRSVVIESSIIIIIIIDGRRFSPTSSCGLPRSVSSTGSVLFSFLHSLA